MMMGADDGEEDDFIESTSESGDSARHWRRALERRGVDEETIRELCTAGQALVATVNSPTNGLDTRPASLLTQLYAMGYESARQGGAGGSGASGSVLSSLFEVSEADFREYRSRNDLALSRFDRAKQRRNSLESSGGSGRVWQQGQGLVESMRHVPQMYFREDFNLSDPETYRAVTGSPSAEMVDADKAWKDVVSQLSQYVDNIEINLLREIEARAAQFFEAMDVLQDLQKSISQACLSISLTRRGLNQHRRTTATAMTKMQRLQDEKRNLEAVLGLAGDLDTAHHASATLRMLLATSDFASILDVLGSLERALGASEVGNLRCFGGSEARIAQVKEDLVGNMEDQFTTLARAATAPLAPPDPSLPERAREGEGEGEAQRLVDGMLPIVLSLHRTGCLGTSLKTYFDHTEHLLKQGMPRHVEALARESAKVNGGAEGEGGEDKEEIGNGNGNGNGDGGDLTSLVVGLSLADFLEMQDTMVTSVRSWIGATSSRMQSTLQAILKESFFVYSQDFELVEESLEEILAVYWAKVIRMRAPCVQHYKLHDYLRLVETTQRMLDGTTDPSREVPSSVVGSSASLKVVRNALNNQSKTYLDVLHKYCKNKLISALEHDQWKTAPISKYVQDIVTDLEDAALYNGGGGGEGRERRMSDPGEAVDAVALGGDNFRLVPSVVVFVQSLSNLITYSRKLPQLTTEVTHRMIELFKIYNALSCSLILGAAAMEKAGLKSISAKHLGSIAMALSFIKRVLLLVQEDLTSRLLPLHQNILMPQFRSLGRDLGEHHQRVCAKLVKIMRDRLAANLGVVDSLSALWDDQHTTSGDDVIDYKPSQFARTVTKQVEVLRSALSSLPRGDLESIFGEIAQVYSAEIVRKLVGLEPPREGEGRHWKGQLRTDAACVLRTLEDLPIDEEAEAIAPLRDFVSKL